MTRLGLGLISAALALIVCGCGPSGGTAVTLDSPSGTTTWYSASEDGKPSPLDDGAVSYAGTNLVVWSSGAKGSGIGSTRSFDGMTIDGFVRFADGKTVNVRCESPDGRTGPVTIGEQTFDLAAGNLFLVAGPGDRPRVKQLKRDLSGVNLKDRKSIQTYGKADAEILAFFSEK